MTTSQPSTATDAPHPTSPGGYRNFSIATLAWALGLALQYFWLQHHLGSKPALLHLIPGSLTLAGVMALSALTWRKQWVRWAVFAGYNLLALRPAVTLDESLAWLQWGAFLAIVVAALGTAVQRLAQEGSGRWLLLAFALVVFNSISHLSLESPFTHTYRLIAGQPSNFNGVDNNTTWECGYDGTALAVQCDARHFVASELIFVDSEFDASYSVVLVRFYSGFLNSLLGSDGLRWHASLAMNMLLWMMSCVVVYRLARLWELTPVAARAAMLANASAWGFVSLVAQPAPYLPAYVFGIFSIWAAAELALARTPSMLRTGALVLLMVLTTGIYESYPVSLACLIVLCWYRRFGAAALMVVGQIALTAVWKQVGLAQILGTLGNMDSASSGASNLSHDIQTWWAIVTGLEISRFFMFIGVGTLAYLFGNLIFGSIAGVGVVVRERRWVKGGDPQRCFWLMLLLVNLLMYAAMVFIVPQTFHWSPSTGMQPRLAFFSFSLNLIAACYWVHAVRPKYVWAVPVACFIIAAIDKTGFASIAMLFDYGSPGWYWY